MGRPVSEEEPPTLIIARRILTEPKTAVAGAKLAASFARSRTSIAMFNEERTLSRPFGGWDLADIVETRRGGGRVVLRVGCEEGHEP